MKPQIYNPVISDEKTPLIRLLENSNHDPGLYFVDEHGEPICGLLSFRDGKLSVFDGVKNSLESRGYSTSFCEWTTNGAALVSFDGRFA